MDTFIGILSLFAVICIAYIVGKLVAKLKLPSILGWLIAGMVFGPYLVGVVSLDTMNTTWYRTIINVFECFAGLMIGGEIVFKKLKAYGAQIMIITLVQSLGTFVVVSAIFSIVCVVAHLPIYLAFIFGGIALATAPAPALSIVKEFNTKGPVTRTLIPLAAIDDVIGVCVFFTVISVVGSTMSGQTTPIWEIVAMILMPFVIGVAVGAPAGFLLKKKRKKALTLLILVSMLLLSVAVGFVFDRYVFSAPCLNYILIGMAFSATFANIVSVERLKEIMGFFNPILSLSLIIVIVNLGMPLNYKLIAGAGVFTAVYIIARAIGKIGGAAVGGAITKSEKTITKCLGLTLLPHSGVSLVFTGIAVTTLMPFDPKSAAIIQGTIAAAAIINEIIAVILAKQGFKWAGEIPKTAKRAIVGNNGAAQIASENLVAENGENANHENAYKEIEYHRETGSGITELSGSGMIGISGSDAVNVSENCKSDI